MESLFKMDYPNFNIYIVDNNSKKEEIEKLEIWGGEKPGFSSEDISSSILNSAINSILLLKSEENLGFGGGNNLVLQKLVGKSSEFIWLLNPDMTVSENALIELTKAHIGIQIQGTPTYDSKNKDSILHLGVGKVNKVSATINFIKNSNEGFDYINGGSMFFPTELLKILGIMPEKYFLYWEETHWCKLASLKNIALSINYHVKVWDKGSTTIGKGKIAEYYYTRNGLMYRKEFEKALIPINTVMHIFRLGYRLITLRFARAYGIYLGLIHFIFGKTGKL